MNQQQVWAGGDFAKVGAAQVIVGERLALAVDIHPGQQVLDVAAGTGNAALAAARRGAAVTARHLPPPPGGPRPTAWGTPERVRELLGDRVSDIRFRLRHTDLCGNSAAERVEFNRTYMGPTKAAFARLDPPAQEKLAADLTADLERFNRATDGTLVAASEYLEVVADVR